MHDLRIGKSSIKHLAGRVDDVSSTPPDSKQIIAKKIRSQYPKEGCYLIIRIFSTSGRAEHRESILRCVHDVLDDMKLFDVNVFPVMQYISIEDKKHYDGEVSVTTLQRMPLVGTRAIAI